MKLRETAQNISDSMVYIFLPVHNRRITTLGFIHQLKKQTHKNYTLVLIDDGSKDGTVEAVREIMSDVVVISGSGNWWWAGSLQQAYKWLRRRQIKLTDNVLIMNDDTLFDPEFIAIGLKIIKDLPGTLLTATGYDVATGLARDTGGYLINWKNLQFIEVNDSAEMNCSSTRGLMMSAIDFLDIKGFRPILIPHYLSDLEFTMRAQKLGKKLMIHPDFKIGIDFEATGYRDVNDILFVDYVKKIFSKKAAMNPFHWSNFIFLHSPWRFKFKNLKCIWNQVYKDIFRDRLLIEIKSFLRK